MGRIDLFTLVESYSLWLAVIFPPGSCEWPSSHGEACPPAAGRGLDPWGYGRLGEAAKSKGELEKSTKSQEVEDSFNFLPEMIFFWQSVFLGD